MFVVIQTFLIFPKIKLNKSNTMRILISTCEPTPRVFFAFHKRRNRLVPPANHFARIYTSEKLDVLKTAKAIVEIETATFPKDAEHLSHIVFISTDVPRILRGDPASFFKWVRRNLGLDFVNKYSLNEHHAFWEQVLVTFANILEVPRVFAPNILKGAAIVERTIEQITTPTTPTRPTTPVPPPVISPPPINIPPNPNPRPPSPLTLPPIATIPPANQVPQYEVVSKHFSPVNTPYSIK
jgi:hypothetical protein